MVLQNVYEGVHAVVWVGIGGVGGAFLEGVYSNKRRTSVEQASKNTRTTLEQHSKRIRTMVEQDSKRTRTTFEGLSGYFGLDKCHLFGCE